MYYLILIATSIVGANKSVAIDHVLFNSKESCMLAARDIEEQKPKDHKLTLFCLRKDYKEVI